MVIASQTPAFDRQRTINSQDETFDIALRLDRLEQLLEKLLGREKTREWYSIQEFSQLVGKAEFTVREHCRLGRLHAAKKASGRGCHQSWVISHDELLRFRRQGLLPLRVQ